MELFRTIISWIGFAIALFGLVRFNIRQRKINQKYGKKGEKDKEQFNKETGKNAHELVMLFLISFVFVVIYIMASLIGGPIITVGPNESPADVLNY